MFPHVCHRLISLIKKNIEILSYFQHYATCCKSIHNANMCFKANYYINLFTTVNRTKAELSNLEKKVDSALNFEWIKHIFRSAVLLHRSLSHTYRIVAAVAAIFSISFHSGTYWLFSLRHGTFITVHIRGMFLSFFLFSKLLDFALNDLFHTLPPLNLVWI